MRRIITIGREYGSGGLEIAKIIAKKLGVHYYDKELITLAAKQGGYDPKIFEKMDERATNSLLYSLSIGSFVLDGRAALNTEMPLADKLHLAQAETIKKLAEAEDCVIVGRCANYILRENKDCVRIFVYGDKKCKIDRLMKLHNVTAEKAESMMKKTDKTRANYYAYYTGENWADMRNFDMAINSSSMCLERVAEAIIDFTNRKLAR